MRARIEQIAREGSGYKFKYQNKKTTGDSKNIGDHTTWDID